MAMTTKTIWNQSGTGNAHVHDGQEGYWATFQDGATAEEVLDEYLRTADYTAATDPYVFVTAAIGDSSATRAVRIGPEGL
jgi:hypothetical protein